VLGLATPHLHGGVSKHFTQAVPAVTVAATEAAVGRRSVDDAELAVGAGAAGDVEVGAHCTQRAGRASLNRNVPAAPHQFYAVELGVCVFVWQGQLSRI